MQSPHHPQVSRRNDGRWVLNCPECQLDDRNRPAPRVRVLPDAAADNPSRTYPLHAVPTRRPPAATPLTARRTVARSRTVAALSHPTGGQGHPRAAVPLLVALRLFLLCPSPRAPPRGPMPNAVTGS